MKLRHFLRPFWSSQNRKSVIFMLAPGPRSAPGGPEQRCSRGHKARGQGQGHKKILRPRTNPLEAKDQGHRRKCSPKKKGLQKSFFRRSQKIRSSKNFFWRSLLEETKKRSFQTFPKVSGVFQRNFNGSKIMLSSSRGQGNFRGLEASRPRPRASKCVLEDSTSGHEHHSLPNGAG